MKLYPFYGDAYKLELIHTAPLIQHSLLYVRRTEPIAYFGEFGNYLLCDYANLTKTDRRKLSLMLPMTLLDFKRTMAILTDDKVIRQFLFSVHANIALLTTKTRLAA